ncbi:hypothetical protein KCU85_g480, partial [Aureobasidium melanogenum]
MARTNAAKPAADEARPAAVGKLLRETILRGSEESLGSDESDSSSWRRRVRNSARQACVRAPEMSWSEPLRSCGCEDHLATVSQTRSSAWLVNEPDSLDDGDVDGSKSARAVYLVVCHDVYCNRKEQFSKKATKIRQLVEIARWARATS